ncbi:MAG: hypothetical protein LBH29_04655, partial [Elusimicrobiota bacterium]|nr:hypothetical protein [Elusimicrobiota bacterium]
MKKAAICIIFVFAAVSFSFAMEKDEPIFKRGVRPMGMGGAFVAVSDDENAAFYNPAGITQRQSWFLSLLGFGASVSNETVNIVTDAVDVMGDIDGGDKGFKMEDLKKVKKVISGKDVDLKLTSLFLEPFFISSPQEIGPNGNTLSWGLGVLSSLDVGVNFMLDLPEYVLDLAEVAQKNSSELDINKVIEVLPPDILQDFGSNLTIPQLSDLLKQIANGGISGDQAAQQIYDSLDTDAKQLIDDLQNGDKKLEDVINEIEQKLPALKEKLLGSVGAKGIVNTYATITFDVPLAYRFKSLDAIKMPGELSVGANIKVIERFKAQSKIMISIDDIGQIEDNFDMLNMAGLSGTGFGLDLGTIYHYTPQWNFGLQISDIFTRINYTGVLV